MVGVVAAAPFVITHSPLRDTLLNWQMPMGGWRIQCDSASLSWTGSQAIANATIFDPAGNVLLSWESLSLERSLLGLLLNSQDLGTVRIVKPTATVATRTDGSNIEDFLKAVAEQQAAKGSSTESAPRLIQLDIIDGTVRGLDQASGNQWSIEQLNVTASLGTPDGIVVADGTASIPGVQPEAAGRLKFRMLPAENERQQLDLLAEGLQLATLSPWIARKLGDSQLAGTSSLDAHAIWAQSDTDPFEVNTWGRAEVVDFQMTGAKLHGDKLFSSKLVLPWKVALADGVVTAEELKFDSDWANLSATGSVALTELQTLSYQNLPKQNFDITGKLSLSKLAKMLPATLQVREGIQIDSGDLQVDANSGDRDGTFQWSIKAVLANLVGRDGARAIQWDEPLAITANWVETADAARLDRVNLSASFAEGDFTTTDDRIHGKFLIDLGKLFKELGQFIDLAGIAANGQAEGKLTLSASEGDIFTAEAEAELKEVVVSQQGRNLWEEPQLDVNLVAGGTAVALVPKSLNSGSLELRGARDVLTVKLLEAVDLSKPVRWSSEVIGTGALEAWAGRLRPWTNAVPDEFSGDAALQAKVMAGEGNLQVRDLNGSVTQLHIRDGNVNLDEPQIQFSGDMQWNPAERKLASQEFQLTSSVVAVRSRELRFEFPAGRVPLMTGEMAVRANMERLAGAAGLVGGRDTTWPRGSAAGVARFVTSAEQVVADFTFDAEQLQLVKASAAGSPVVIWSEPKLHSTGKAVYEITSEQASVENLLLEGQTVQIAGAAVWTKPLANGPISMKGNLQYDPAALASLVANYAGPSVNVQGDRIIHFDARGQLPTDGKAAHWSRNWQGTAETGWTGASVFGLPISAGKLQGTLAEGRIQTAPLDVSVGEGRLTINPLAILDPPPQKIIIPAGPLFTNVQISPAVSEQMLKYVAPVLAGATRVDGKFSLSLAETQVSLADPKQTRTAGQLGVHQLTVLPGPMIADVVNIIRQVESLKNSQNLLGAPAEPKQTKLLSMNDQQIEFQVVDGRVYHRKLEFIIDKVPIRSQGSVGFDQTLALMIEIPIQDRWIDGEDALRGLAGQTLQIPIQGTFQKPRIDERAIADITRQLIRNTAREAIGGEINRQLEKLFQGK
jgi:hypothetical protein